MCGIVGIITPVGARPSAGASDVALMRDTLTHRGPDDDGLEDLEHVLLGHRRLTVIDTSAAGRQPMFTPDRRHVIVYNGELYNDLALREELSRDHGVQFRTACDTETVLQAVAVWGLDAASRLRGMYAFAVFDLVEQAAVLARDPLGIKPLYVHTRTVGDHAELVFASEPGAILAHPLISFEPDWPGVSAYLTTIRTVTGARTMFKGIFSLRPGEWRRYNLRDPELVPEQRDAGTVLEWDGVEADASGLSNEGADELRTRIHESVHTHLRSDVPMCSLLSGGLDSSIIAALAMDEVGALNTYCSGSVTDDPGEDFGFARQVSGALGTNHTEAIVSRELFAERWPDMVRRQGVPVSTPNEIAINEVCRTLRAAGNVVALTGEGADELFGGYGPPLQVIHEHCLGLRTPVDHEGGTFQLRSQQWVPLESKSIVLNPQTLSRIENDALVIGGYREEFRRMLEAGANEHPMQAHLRFQRRVNLANLLQRLDTASMLESVEGRTPLADVAIGALAERLPLASKFEGSSDPKRMPPKTKTILRNAFADRLPEDVVKRPKASFPLPFIQWMPDHLGILDRPAARELFSSFAIDTVKANPVREWPLAWPMMNAVLWYERWAG